MLIIIGILLYLCDVFATGHSPGQRECSITLVLYTTGGDNVKNIIRMGARAPAGAAPGGGGAEAAA